ncbi:MAG: helix-turn-helix domain-containing protein [Chloroflexi bacterium]|nr:helix-turn-helix domain-containing protein [Chloroflexota bacterium]
MSEENQLLTAVQVAERLNTSKAFAYTLLRRGEMPVVRMGKTVRVRPEDLEMFIVSSLDEVNHGKKTWKP